MKIGLMSFAHTHAAGYMALLGAMDDVELLTSDPEHVERPGETGGAEMAAEHGAAYVDSYDELFAWQPDAVVICSQNVRHRRDVERAAAAGVHVLCEKPLATSIEDATAILAAVEAAGIRLMTAYPVRFSPAFTALRAAIEGGQLGELRSFVGTNNGSVPAGRRAWFVDPEQAGGGALIDHVVHLADLMDVLLDGDRATSVYATANAHLPGAGKGAETAGLVSISYACGVSATIDSSWSVPVSAPQWGGLTLKAIGSAGVAAMDAFNQRVDGFSEATASPLWLSYGHNLDALMLADFLSLVRGGPSAGADGAGGLRTAAVAVAALESVRTGQAVSVDL
ncbi:Gfo/Idh/MocA family protein [Propionibacteriaceae bacterium Y1700]|uniref:Gfo/Idh/MocA family protein n=1 Tax=Microlunatus sp. Y1700 TaxID=3418487 RepID=UPI003DA79DC7